MIPGADRSNIDGDSEIESRCIYDLSIGCVFQNESRFLKEWIEFHKLMGVQHFVLVDDRSTDDFWGVLQPYVQSGEVELFSNPCPELLRNQEWIKFQTAVHQAVVKHMLGVSRWLALVDVDEFIVPSDTRAVVDFLRDYEDYGALYIRWEPFGTSHLAKIPDQELMTTALYLKWKFIRGHDMPGKSIVKPHRVHHAYIHNCELIASFQYWDSNPDMQSEAPSIRLFHYWTRDEDFLFRFKLPRVLLIKQWARETHDPAFFKTLFNDVPDYSMIRYQQELRAGMCLNSPRRSEANNGNR